MQWRITLKKQILSLALILALASQVMAQDASFNKTRYSSLKEKNEIDVMLVVTDAKITIRGKKANKKSEAIDMEIPFTSIDDMSYELAARHRVAEGAAIMAISLGAGAVLMATKTKSHWLAIEYHESNAAKQTAILRLDKSEYENIIKTLEARTGKPIAILDSKTNPSNPINPEAGSKDMDEVVAFNIDKVLAALRPAMENIGCKVTTTTPDRIECKRGRGSSERAGNGGEKVTATVEAQGDQTRVRIWTGKGFVGRLEKNNWSTPVYQEMLKVLQKPAAN